MAQPANDRAAVARDAATLAGFVRTLADFEMCTTAGDPYDHVGATVADAILQANRRYVAFVAPRVRRIRERYPVQRTTSGILAVLGTVPMSELLQLKDAARAARVAAVLALLAREGVDTEADLRDWLVSADGGTKLRAIPGIGPKTADYFKILVGLPESAIDRHLDAFLLMAGIGPLAYADAQAVINEAADVLGVGRALFDHSIWQYMSLRAKGARSHVRGAQGVCHADIAHGLRTAPNGAEPA